jgi:tripartite-type tricarboxylate transporter receptor subunit TctC
MTKSIPSGRGASAACDWRNKGLPRMKNIFTALVSLIALTVSSSAQDYPSRLIKMIHGFPPGGNVDIIARLIASEMQKGLGQNIVIEPKPGLAGNIAAETVARSDPDGYTLLTVPSAHAATGAIAKNLKYKVVDDFDWISTVSFYPFLICVRKDSRFQTLAELIKEAKSKPGILSYGSAGVGSILHTTVELLANMTEIKFAHIPYRGEAPALTGLLSGDFDFIAATTGATVPRVKSGEVRALATTGKVRWRELPDVPTVNEAAGLNTFEVISWTGIATTAGVSKQILNRLHAEVTRTIAVPDIRDRLQSMGGEVRGTTPSEMRALVTSQLALWTKVAREQNIQGE